MKEEDQWKNYATKVKLIATMMTRPPKWETVRMLAQKRDLERLMNSDVDPDAVKIAMKKEIRSHGTEHPEVKKYRIGQLDEVEIGRLRRQQQSNANDQERKLNHKLKELASIRADLVKVRMNMFELTEGTDKERTQRDRA